MVVKENLVQMVYQETLVSRDLPVSMDGPDSMETMLVGISSVTPIVFLIYFFIPMLLLL